MSNQDREVAVSVVPCHLGRYSDICPALKVLTLESKPVSHLAVAADAVGEFFSGELCVEISRLGLTPHDSSPRVLALLRSRSFTGQCAVSRPRKFNKDIHLFIAGLMVPLPPRGANLDQRGSILRFQWVGWHSAWGNKLKELGPTDVLDQVRA